MVGLQGNDGRRGTQDTARMQRTLIQVAKLDHFSVDDFCQETRTVYEFLGWYYHGHTYQHYSDVCTMRGDALAERYKRTIVRIEQITRAGYHLEVQWECEFDEEILSHHPE